MTNKTSNTIIPTPTFKSAKYALLGLEIEDPAVTEGWAKFGDESALLITSDEGENDPSFEVSFVHLKSFMEGNNDFSLTMVRTPEGDSVFPVKDISQLMDVLYDYFEDSGVYWGNGRKLDITLALKAVAEKDIFPALLVHDELTDLLYIEAKVSIEEEEGEPEVEADGFVGFYEEPDPVYGPFYDETNYEPFVDDGSDYFLDSDLEEVPFQIEISLDIEDEDDPFSKDNLEAIQEIVKELSKEYRANYELLELKQVSDPDGVYLHGVAVYSGE